MFYPKNFGVIASFLPNKVGLMPLLASISPMPPSSPHPSSLPPLSSSPLPSSQSPADCVQYYYLSKKREKFKHLVRKANLKRKKPFVKPSSFSNSQLASSSVPPLPISLFSSVKPKAEENLSPEDENGILHSGNVLCVLDWDSVGTDNGT